MKDQNFNQAVINLYQAFLRLSHDDLDNASADDIKLLELLRNHEIIKAFKSETTKV